MNGYLELGTAAVPTAFATETYSFAAQYVPGGQGMFVFTSASPVQARYTALGDPDLTAGHSDIYALVARAVAP